jgi:hypothetical protein
MLPLKVKRAMEAIKKRKRKERKNRKEKEKEKEKEKKRIKKKGAALLSFIHTCAHVLAPALFIVIICAHVQHLHSYERVFMFY